MFLLLHAGTAPVWLLLAVSPLDHMARPCLVWAMDCGGRQKSYLCKTFVRPEMTRDDQRWPESTECPQNVRVVRTNSLEGGSSHNGWRRPVSVCCQRLGAREKLRLGLSKPNECSREPVNYIELPCKTASNSTSHLYVGFRSNSFFRICQIDPMCQTKTTRCKGPNSQGYRFKTSLNN